MKSNLVLYRFPKDWAIPMYFEVSKTYRQKRNLMNTIGVIKYKKSTIRNQSIIQFFFTNGSPKGGCE
jgi:hypothetical protein